MDISGIDMIQLTLILCFMFYTLLLCMQHVRGLLALGCLINNITFVFFSGRGVLCVHFRLFLRLKVTMIDSGA